MKTALDICKKYHLGSDAELDILRYLEYNYKKWVASEEKKERTETHIVDSSKFNKAKIYENCKYGEVDPRQYGLDLELMKMQWEQIVNDLDKLKEHIRKRGLSPNSIKEFIKTQSNLVGDIEKLTTYDDNLVTRTSDKTTLVNEITSDEWINIPYPYKELLDKLDKWIEDSRNDKESFNASKNSECAYITIGEIGAFGKVKNYILKNAI